AHAGRAAHLLDGQLGGLFAHGVARALDGSHGRLRVGRAGEADIGALRGEIDRGRIDTRELFECALDTAYAGRAGHAFDRQTQAAARGPGWRGAWLEDNGSH